MKGYTGKILHVDLSSGRIWAETIADVVYEQLLSGVGLGAFILYRDIPADAAPLGPDNILGLVSGLLSGTPSVVTGRWMAVCKSPITGGWGDANCGGSLSPAIKQCGYDGIFFRGISPEPVYLYLDHKHAELRSAQHVWGLDAIESEITLQKENWATKKPSVAVIGPAGEKQSLIAGICNDRGRIAARSGVGAVMGSKRLKAVVLAGSRTIGCHDPAGMKAISKALSGNLRKLQPPPALRGSLLPLAGMLMNRMKKAAPLDGLLMGMLMKKWGTSVNNGLGVVTGDSPIKNWGGSVADYNHGHYRRLNPDLILRREKSKYHCNACVIGCGGTCTLTHPDGEEPSLTHKPEYETCAAFGGLVLNQDLDAIFTINELLNRAGMDSISAGATIAFAIECRQNDVLTDQDCDGLDLTWGNASSIIELVKRMIDRQGIGDLLADGVKAAAQKLGATAEPFAVTAGGQEPGMHDPRLDPVVGVHYSTDATPGRHTIGSGQYYDTIHLWEKVSWAPNPGAYLKSDEFIASEKLALKTAANACYKSLVDGAGGCLFAMILGVNHWQLFEWLNAATGWQKSPDEYMETGRRIQTLRQLFNIKQKIDPWQFKMSPRMAGNPPLTDGPLKGRTIPIEAMMQLHWQAMGWDAQTGIPSQSFVQQMGLDMIQTEQV